jgi:hypothetical protein
MNEGNTRAPVLQNQKALHHQLRDEPGIGLGHPQMFDLLGSLRDREGAENGGAEPNRSVHDPDDSKEQDHKATLEKIIWGAKHGMVSAAFLESVVLRSEI